MNQRHFLAVGTAAVFLLAAGGEVSANMKEFTAFKKAYPGKQPKEYSCKICHLGAVGKATDLNAYGKALAAYKAGAGKTGPLTDEDFKAVEKEDPDGDGAASGDELAGGTLPGDPASKPAAP